MSYLENDMTRPHPQTKEIIHLGKETKDSVKINCIHQTWLNYFHKLWFQDNAVLKLPHSANNETETISMDELTTVLTDLKCNKAPGEDLINGELFKYATPCSYIDSSIPQFHLGW